MGVIISSKHQETLDKVIAAANSQNSDVNSSGNGNPRGTCIKCVGPVDKTDGVFIRITETHDGIDTVQPYSIHYVCLNGANNNRKYVAPVRTNSLELEYAFK